MNAGDQVARQLRHVRRLLERFAAPHPAVHFITDDVEAHVARLDPELTVLEPAPFSGLGTVRQGTSGSHSPARRSPPRTTTVPTSLAELRRRPAESAHHPARSARSQHVGERLSPAASNAPRVTGATLPVQRLTKQGALPPVSSPEVSRENPPGLSALAELADVTADEQTPPPGAVRADADQVDLEALVHRVLRRRRSRHGVMHAARSAVPGESPTEAPSASHAARIAREPEVTSAAVVQRLALPVSPRRARAATSAQTSLQGHKSTSEKSESLPPLTPVHSPPTMTPSPSPVRSAHIAFFFDPFEPREPADIGEHTLTDRIDQALREQARRQGVDLT